MNRVLKCLTGVLLFIGGIYWVANHFVAGPKMVFHGRAVGADGKGLPGVNVEYRIGKGSIAALVMPFAFNPQSRGSVMSDENGNFQITGRGHMLSVTGFGKQGYRAANWNPVSFGYFGTPDPHRGSPADPTLFLMTGSGSRDVDY